MTYASDVGVLAAQMNAAILASRPSVLYQPKLSIDGNMWCALYGDNIMDGCAGFGETPCAAMYAFDLAWERQKPPVCKDAE